MPLSENEIKNLLSLDDDRLREVIVMICDAVGAERSTAAKLSANPAELRSMMSGMSADEVNRLLDRAGREKSEQVLNTLRKGL